MDRLPHPLRYRRAPPASTQQNPNHPVLAQQQTIAEDEKDVGEDETDRKEPSFAEATEKNEEDETVTKPSGDEAEATISCDEKGVDEGFPYARPPVCELAGDIRISPREKTMFFVNPPGAGPFHDNGENNRRPRPVALPQRRSSCSGTQPLPPLSSLSPLPLPAGEELATRSGRHRGGEPARPVWRRASRGALTSGG